MEFSEFRKLCEERKELEGKKKNGLPFDHARLKTLQFVLENKDFGCTYEDYFHIDYSLFKKLVEEFFNKNYKNKDAKVTFGQAEGSTYYLIKTKNDNYFLDSVRGKNLIDLRHLYKRYNFFTDCDKLIKDYPGILEVLWEAVRIQMHESDYREIETDEMYIAENNKKLKLLQDKNLIQKEIERLKNENKMLKQDKKQHEDKLYTFDEVIPLEKIEK